MINSYHHDNLYDKGWILFFNSCGDYSGFSGLEHNQAEKLIKYYLNKREIELETINISLNKLKKFLGERSIIYRNERELGIKVNALEGRDKEMKGFLFELFSCYYISKTWNNVEVLWSNGKEENNEVDILVKGENKIEFVECKINPNTIDLKKEIDKIEMKSKMFSSDLPKGESFLFWKEPNATQKKMLADAKMKFEFISLTARNKLNANKHTERLFAIFDEEAMSLLDRLNLEIEE